MMLHVQVVKIFIMYIYMLQVFLSRNKCDSFIHIPEDLNFYCILHCYPGQLYLLFVVTFVICFNRFRIFVTFSYFLEENYSV